MATDEGHESDQMFEFDGVSSAVAIPEAVLDHGLSPQFTISTWMKHKPLPHQVNTNQRSQWYYHGLYASTLDNKSSVMGRGRIKGYSQSIQILPVGESMKQCWKMVFLSVLF